MLRLVRTFTQYHVGGKITELVVSVDGIDVPCSGYAPLSIEFDMDGQRYRISGQTGENQPECMVNFIGVEDAPGSRAFVAIDELELPDDHPVLQYLCLDGVPMADLPSDPL